ncbi:hypothetical protein MRB53_001930 [Persea americana]|uniref:Uncharacterized protein n=1 Tax=Persea americana TaxID=3435 RepID=A0ACC2MT27_PERAE|nr:hypothetical protein MRB53_001930 [Persea americana]
MKMSLWMEERLKIAVMVGQMPNGDTREMLVGLKVSNMSNDIHCMMGTFMLGRLSSATVAIKMLATPTSCKRSTSAPGHIPTSIKRHPEAPCTRTTHNAGILEPIEEPGVADGRARSVATRSRVPDRGSRSQRLPELPSSPTGVAEVVREETGRALLPCTTLEKHKCLWFR